MDRMYIEFNRDQFQGIQFNKEEEPELAKFISDIQSGAHKFHDYPPEEIDYYASRIYELRKNNSNNTAG